MNILSYYSPPSWLFLLLQAHVVFNCNIRSVKGNIQDLQEMIARIEFDTRLFAVEMENLILSKCNFTSDETCYKANYHGCDSELAYASCPGEDYSLKQCGLGKEGGCGGLFDFTTSIAVAAPEKNPITNVMQEPNDNKRVKDGICYTRLAEPYMRRATEVVTPYWEKYDVFPPWFHYGNDDGVFRIFPGSPGNMRCPNGVNDFDPRVRPWYIAASSGPKDVILVLDTSGSMRDYGRMDIMKAAALRVVNTLGVSDFFTVIEFNTNAKVLGGGDKLMMRATATNKQKMVKEINSLRAGGGTEFINGFRTAFQTFDSSFSQDMSSGCHRSILFLSDGRMGDDKDTLLTYIQQERAKYTAKNKDPPVMFTYSFGAGADDEVPKEIACDNDGIWSKIGDGEDLARSMGAYYKYFAYGLGDDKRNEDFVAWVEPYDFSTDVGLGITASAPVFDRTVSPPLLDGVVGLDLSFAALERAVGGNVDDAHRSALTTIIDRSTAVCPNIELTPCQLESLRMYGANDEGDTNSLCHKCGTSPSSPNSASIIPPLKAPVCPNYASDVWNNRLNKGRTFEEKSCCKVGAEPRVADTATYEEIKNDLMCVEKGATSHLVVIFSIVGAVLGTILICVAYVCWRRKTQITQSHYPTSSMQPISYPPPEQAGVFVNQHPIAPIESDVVVMPPPTAPTTIVVAERVG